MFTNFGFFFRHIQEEFDHMFTKKEIRKLTSEEMAFAWFRYPKSIVSTLLSYMPIIWICNNSYNWEYYILNYDDLEIVGTILMVTRWLMD